MNRPSRDPGSRARRPIFFWITVGLLGMLVLCGAALALLLVLDMKRINTQGGWGWLLAAAIFAATAALACAACAVCAAISLLRRETHRRLSIVFLLVSCLVVWMFKGVAIRVVQGLVGLSHGPAKASGAPPSLVPGTVSGATTISDSLVQHFRARGARTPTGSSRGPTSVPGARWSRASCAFRAARRGRRCGRLSVVPAVECP
jgi:hypothetical protein